VSGTISATDTPAFAETLVAALRDIARFDYSAMFAYCGKALQDQRH
jgi:hypothetical protein